MPAHITAKIVMASAARFTPVRQRCRSRKRIAEIRVPAWPMPIHQTKLTMSHAHITGCMFPQTPTPVEICQESMKSKLHNARKLGTKSTHHQRGAFPSLIEAIWLEIQPKLRKFATRGTR